MFASRDGAHDAEVTLDRQKLKEQIHELYRSEHDEMGERGTLERLERGQEWDLAPTLASGGVVVFPHAGVLDCGHQVAAAVQGCLDSGADRVIVISVLHAFTDEMQEARTRVSAGDDPSEWPFWGIQGPGLEGAKRVARRPRADQLPALLGGGDEAARDHVARKSSSGTRTWPAATPSGCPVSRSSPPSRRTP